MDAIRTTTATSALREPHPEWGNRSQSLLEKVDLRFVLSAWAWCVVATLVLAGAVSAIVVYGAGAALTAAEAGYGYGYGLGTVVFAFSTFIAFSAVLAVLLTRESGDRLINSLAISVLHLGLALTVIFVDVALRIVTGTGSSELVSGAWAEQAGTTLTLLVQAAPAAVFACLLAVGTVPTGGPPPAGTEHPEFGDSEW
jgi:hypothetical protein